MRTTLQTTIRAATMAGVFLIAACGYNNNQDYSTGPGVTGTTVPSALTTGTWTISSMMQRTTDMSSQFSGFVFVFTGAGESGTVTATKGGTSVSGTWTHTAGVSTAYGTSTGESIALSFGTASPFDGLSGTWIVMANSSTSLSLASADATQDEHLVFVKQ